MGRSTSSGRLPLPSPAMKRFNAATRIQKSGASASEGVAHGSSRMSCTSLAAAMIHRVGSLDLRFSLVLLDHLKNYAHQTLVAVLVLFFILYRGLALLLALLEKAKILRCVMQLIFEL